MTKPGSRSKPAAAVPSGPHKEDKDPLPKETKKEKIEITPTAG